MQNSSVSTGISSLIKEVDTYLGKITDTLGSFSTHFFTISKFSDTIFLFLSSMASLFSSIYVAR